MAIAEVDVKKLHGHGFRRIRRSKVGHNLQTKFSSPTPLLVVFQSHGHEWHVTRESEKRKKCH